MPAPSTPALVLAALVAGLLAIERKAFLQASAARPLVAGTLLGLVLGQPLAGLSLGAALELFFLGSVNLGAALPDNDLFPTTAATCCACALLSAAPLPLETALAASTFLSLAAAKLGIYTDRLSERFNGWAASRAQAEGSIHARLRHNLFGLWVPFLTTALIAGVGGAAGRSLLPPLLAHAPASLTRTLAAAWIVFLVVAAATALRSIRTPRAFFVGGLAGLVAVGGQLMRSFVL